MVAVRLVYGHLNIVLSLICAGFDTSPLADAHPTQFLKTLFPGQDYNDARFRDFEEVDHPWSNTISVREQPRMPWQDVCWAGLKSSRLLI